MQLVNIPRVAGRRLSLKTAENTQIPVQRIHSKEDLERFKQTEAYLRLLDFIQSLNESVRNKKISDECYPSEIVVQVLKQLDVLDTWIAEIPPAETLQRFGNISFRHWIARLKERSVELHRSIIPEAKWHFIPELSEYLVRGFGDGTRLDYGSGHELAFVAWLNCLDLIDLVRPNDYQAIVLRVFTKYLDVVRHLQQEYRLEPAGSHGVWGLDDHQFLPYFWGSSQLLDHPKIKPKSIMNKDIVEHFAKDYLYLGCIDYILRVKTGPFFEHSPMLYDISGVPVWHKVNTGMLKMYIAEVLDKFPVVQHFVFGALLPFEPAEDHGRV